MYELFIVIIKPVSRINYLKKPCIYRQKMMSTCLSTHVPLDGIVAVIISNPHAVMD